MIKIIKLISGETIIGELEADSIDPAVIYDPMVIEVYKDESEMSHMRLNSAVSLSNADYLVFEKKHVLTFYQPLDILIKYYKEVRSYVDEDRKFAESRIEDALENIAEYKKLTKKIKEMSQNEDLGGEVFDNLSKFVTTKNTANTNIH